MKDFLFNFLLETNKILVSGHNLKRSTGIYKIKNCIHHNPGFLSSNVPQKLITESSQHAVRRDVSHSVCSSKNP